MAIQTKPYTITVEPGRLLTVDEFAALPPDPDGWRSELIEGRVIRMPPVIDPHHDEIIANLVAALLPFVRARKLGRVTLQQVGYNITPAGANNGPAVAPDLAFVSRGRGQLVRDARARKQYMRLAPDLAVEVVSPSQATESEMEGRAQRWLQGGTRLVWNIWPDPERVDVWPADGERQTLKAPALLDGQDVIPGFSIPIADLFIYDEDE
jgi:Uma2 family endonuclease